MKISSVPTDYILISAHTCSDWDDCDFAVIHCDGAWRKRISARLKDTASFHADPGFLSFNYLDNSVEFYVSREELPGQLTESDGPVFVEFDEGGEEALTHPETYMDSGRIAIYRDGTACYMKYGKYTNDEFSTEAFSLPDILEQYAGHADRHGREPGTDSTQTACGCKTAGE